MNKLFTKKIGGKKGFTLAELLIVVAIIAILSAIGIAAYTDQMATARQRVDEANLRAAKSMASATNLMTDGGTDDIYYTIDAEGNLVEGTATLTPRYKITVEDGVITASVTEASANP